MNVKLIVLAASVALVGMVSIDNFSSMKKLREEKLIAEKLPEPYIVGETQETEPQVQEAQVQEAQVQEPEVVQQAEIQQPQDTGLRGRALTRYQTAQALTSLNPICQMYGKQMEYAWEQGRVALQNATSYQVLDSYQARNVTAPYVQAFEQYRNIAKSQGCF